MLFFMDGGGRVYIGSISEMQSGVVTAPNRLSLCKDNLALWNEGGTFAD